MRCHYIRNNSLVNKAIEILLKVLRSRVIDSKRFLVNFYIKERPSYVKI